MTDKIIYVVSGVVRSGTSMMMRSLIAGGMATAFDQRADEYMQPKDAYLPNKDGFYELSYRHRHESEFPAMYEGMLIKLLLHRVHELYSMPKGMIFKTIMMRRDREEIFKSINRVKQYRGEPLNDEEVINSIIEAENNIPFIKKHSITFDEIWYPDILVNPLEIFKQLQYHGWPINPEMSAKIPEPEQYRCKKD